MSQQGKPAWLTAAERLGIHVPEPAIPQFRTYRELLVDWNQRINLTAIRDPDEIDRLLFLDSLTVLLAVSESGRGGEGERGRAGDG